MPLAMVISRLEAEYGKPKPPPRDPWALILWENVAYLANDDRRGQAFHTLRKRIGIQPAKILAASDDALLEVTSFGIMAEKFTAKLRTCAETALREFDGDLSAVLKLSQSKARKALQKFPGIGGPGADKILLFAHTNPSLPLDSNGCRVLCRLGLGKEDKDYSKMYRLVQRAIEPELDRDFPWLIASHQLLRRHGQEMCNASRPLCGGCPLADQCPSREL
jgi:endonuclease III